MGDTHALDRSVSPPLPLSVSDSPIPPLAHSPIPAGSCKPSQKVTLYWISRDDPRALEVQALRSGGRVGVCLGRVVGTIQSDPDAARTGYIHWLGVEPEHQRQGIGRSLLREMIARMRSMGLRQVFLTTGSQNWRAQPLYYSEGFTLAGTSISFLRETAPVI